MDEERLYDFYDQRIPDGISTTPAFEQWLRVDAKSQPKHLYLSEADLLRETAEPYTPAQFPDSLDIQGMRLPLESYNFV